MIYKARVSVVVSRTYEFDLDVDEDDAEFDFGYQVYSAI